LTAARRAGPILAALAAVAAFAALVFSQMDMRSDMADFLPAGQTEAARFMLQELRSGTATGLILVGIEDAPPPDLARISAGVAAALDRSGLFTIVSNGQQALDGPDGQVLFDSRYLLSPGTTVEAFTTESLHAGMERLLQGLQSSASPLVSRLGLPDPTGAFPALAQVWIGGSHVRTQDGVWFAPDRDRALLLAQTRAGGMEIAAQDRVDAAIRDAFANASPGPARLLVSGPAVFARQAAHAIKADVEMLSVVSALLVAGLLWWRFRSPLVIAAIAVPITLGVAVAALVVQAAFGFVHGIAFGFGMTMLGVTVDYPVLLIGHRKAGEAAPGTLRRIGRAFAMAVATAALGLTGMVFSGFPGLSQLGLFSVVGVLTAAAATRFLLPRLIVAADLASVSAGDPATLLRVERLRAGRLWGLAPIALAAALLLVHRPQWEGDLANLSPVPKAARDLDAELRRELGAPDVGQIVVVRAGSADAVLRAQESLLPRINVLQRQSVITGAEAAARFLPSAETQRARQAALPDAAILAARIEAARQGLPFRPDAFAVFANAVEAARTAAPITLDTLGGPAATARLHALLFQRDDAWFGPIAFQGVIDPGRLAAAFAGAGMTFVDMHAETNGIVAGYAARAWIWLSAGALAAALVLATGLRSLTMTLRVVGAIGAAMLVTIAILTAAGARLSLLNLVALQFVAGVGLDYALFYARRQLDQEERARTLRTLATCNAMTLLTFGILALCRTPLLQAIGVTVAIGAVAAMCFSFLFVGLRPRVCEEAG